MENFFGGGVGAVGLQGERREDESSLTEFRILQSLMEGSGKYYCDTAEIPPPPQSVNKTSRSPQWAPGQVI